MSRTTVIAFANNKGGSGKTTTCSNVGCALAAMGKRVLLIDGDMQMNLTLSCFDEERAMAFATGDKNIYHAIKAGMDMAIVNPSTKVMYSDIPTELREALEDVILVLPSCSVFKIFNAASVHPRAEFALKLTP